MKAVPVHCITTEEKGFVLVGVTGEGAEALYMCTCAQNTITEKQPHGSLLQ